MLRIHQIQNSAPRTPSHLRVYGSRWLGASQAWSKQQPRMLRLGGCVGLRIRVYGYGLGLGLRLWDGLYRVQSIEESLGPHLRFHLLFNAAPSPTKWWPWWRVTFLNPKPETLNPNSDGVEPKPANPALQAFVSSGLKTARPAAHIETASVVPG